MAKKKSFRTTEEWFEHGRQCFHKPDGIGAVNAFNEVIDRDPAYRHPDGDNPFFYLGKIHEMENRIDEAIIHYTRSLAINQYDEESLVGRGSCYTVTKLHEQAISDFTKALKLPDHQRNVPKKHLFYAMAENYRQMEDFGQAIYWVQKALNEDPNNQRHQELFKKLTSKVKLSKPLRYYKD